MTAPTITHTWLDCVGLDCDRCESPDGSIRLAYVCDAEGCTDHTASVCVVPDCQHLDPGTSHVLPTGFRTMLRAAALRSLSEARP